LTTSGRDDIALYNPSPHSPRGRRASEESREGLIEHTEVPAAAMTLTLLV